MDVHPEDNTSYPTQYEDVFPKYVENEYWSNNSRLSVITPVSVPSNNLCSSGMASRSGQCSSDPYDLSSADEEYSMPKNVAETTPRMSDCAAHWFTAARRYWNSLPEFSENLGRIKPNLNDYHSDHMEIYCTFWLPDITDWWLYREETYSQYPNLSNVVCDVLSIIPHGVGVEASFSLGWDVISWRQWKPSGKTNCDKFVIRQLAWANDGILAGSDPPSDTRYIPNNLGMKREVEEINLHRVAKVNDFLEMWQGSRNLCATQKKSRAQN